MNTQIHPTAIRTNKMIWERLVEEAKLLPEVDLEALQQDIDKSNRIDVTFLVKIKGKLQEVTINDLWHVKFDYKRKVLELFFGERVGANFGLWCAFIHNVKTIISCTTNSNVFELNSEIALDLLNIDIENK